MKIDESEPFYPARKYKKIISALGAVWIILKFNTAFKVVKAH